MKAIKFLIYFMLISTCAFSAQFTDNYSLEIPTQASRNWIGIISADFISIDQIIHNVSEDTTLIPVIQAELGIISEDVNANITNINILSDDASWTNDGTYTSLIDETNKVVIGYDEGDYILNVVASDTDGAIAIDTYDGSPTDNGRILFRTSNSNTKGVLSETDDGDYLGRIDGYGVTTGSAWGTGCGMLFIQNGSAGASYVPSNISFYTSTGGALNSNQLVMSSDGSVIITQSTANKNALRISSTTSVSAPALAFGDGDSGIYESSDDVIRVSINGAARLQVDTDGLSMGSGAKPALFYSTPTDTVPSIAPYSGDANTGIGWGGDDTLSLIAGGTERVRISADGSVLSNGNVIPDVKTISVTITDPLDLTEADTLPIWKNDTGEQFVVTEINANSDTDNVAFVLKSCSRTNHSALTNIAAMDISADGTAVYYVDKTSGFDSTIVPDGYQIVFDNDAADDPAFINISIVGVLGDND